MTTIEFPNIYSSKYKELILTELKENPRFVLDAHGKLYFGSEGKLNEISLDQLTQNMAILSREHLMTLWEVAPALYRKVSHLREKPLKIRDLSSKIDFPFQLEERFPELITYRDKLPGIPLMLTAEGIVPVFYKPELLPGYIFDKDHLLVFSADFKHGILKRLLDEVRSCLGHRQARVVVY